MNKIICHDCALPLQLPRLQSRQKAVCPRCHFTLSHFKHHDHQTSIAMAITALIFFGLSLSFTFLELNANGISHSIHISHTIVSFIGNHYLPLAIFQVMAIICIPVGLLFCALYLQLPVMLQQAPLPASRFIYRLLFALFPWTMAEIFLIGCLVSLIKIASLADVSIGIGFYCYLLFSMALVFCLANIDRQRLGRSLNIISGHSTHAYKSPQISIALLITAFILYIPASTLPIMNTELLGNDSPSTIMGGVLTLWHHGSYPIAAVIFIASVMVPIAKMVALAWLHYSVYHLGGKLQPQRTRLLRLTEILGRWSMIDVFVVVLLSSLIQLGNTMTIYPGPAALAFSGVVIVTMLAAMSFNPHLLWRRTHG